MLGIPFLKGKVLKKGLNRWRMIEWHKKTDSRIYDIQLSVHNIIKQCVLNINFSAGDILLVHGFQYLGTTPDRWLNESLSFP